MTTYSPGVTTTNSLLEINNISVDYYAANGTVHALTDVRITLERGQILGLAGESGSGKSTLAYAITRLLHPPAAITGGEVLYYPRSRNQGQRERPQGSPPRFTTTPVPMDAIAPVRGKLRGKHQSPSSAISEPVDILQLTPAQLRAFRWSELAIVFQSAMNALNPILNIGAQIYEANYEAMPGKRQGQ